MNKRGAYAVKGFALLTMLLVFFLALFGLINPFKTTLDNARGGATLNCPGTPDFNQTSYNLQNASQKIIYRPTCFVTGISMVWFVGAFLVAGIVWVVRNWR